MHRIDTLRAAIAEAGLTQTAAAEQLGVPRSTLTCALTGRRDSLRVWCAMARWPGDGPCAAQARALGEEALRWEAWRDG